MGTRRKGKRRGFEEILEDYWSIQEVAARYGLRVRNYRRLGSVYRLETQDGAKRLKRFDKSERDMLFVYSACEHLACQGFDKGPNFVLSLDGHPYVQVAGDIYYVTDWVDGRECDLSNICELEAACKILAQMHLASSGFAAQAAPQEGGRELVPLEGLFTSRMKHLYSLRESVEGRARKSKFDIRFLKYMDDFVKLGDLAIADLERSGYLPENATGLCVRNYGPDVLVTRPDGQMCLVDMDECYLGDRLIDLGDFIRARCEWDVDRAVFMMEVYHMVYPLSRPEASALLAYIKFPMDLWKVVTDNYYRGYEDRRAMRELVKTLDKREEFIEALDSADLGFLDIIVPSPQAYCVYGHDADRQDMEQAGQHGWEMRPAAVGQPGPSEPPLEGTEADKGELFVDQGSVGDEAESLQHASEPQRAEDSKQVFGTISQMDEDVEEALDTMPDIPDFGLPFVVEEVIVQPRDDSDPYVPEELVPEEGWPEEWTEESEEFEKQSAEPEVEPRVPRGHGHAAFIPDLGDLEDVHGAAGKAQDAESRDPEGGAEALDARDALALAAGLTEETVVSLISGEQVRSAMERVVGLDKDETLEEPVGEYAAGEHAEVTAERSGLSTHAPGSEATMETGGVGAETVAEAGVEAEAEAMPDAKAETGTALEAERQAEPAVEIQEAPKAELATEPMDEAKSERREEPIAEAKAALKAEPKAGASLPQAPALTGTLVWKAFPKPSRASFAKAPKGDSAASGKPKAGR